MKFCPGRKELGVLVRSHAPLESDASPPYSRLQRPVLTSPLLDTAYQNVAPPRPPPHTEDPVYNHGSQLSVHLSSQRRNYESQELLGKVFQSWQSRSLAPVNGAAITALKRMSRLLHLCSSPLLPPLCLREKAFLERVKESALSDYIAYLQSLGFQVHSRLIVYLHRFVLGPIERLQN